MTYIVHVVVRCRCRLLYSRCVCCDFCRSAFNCCS